MNLEVLAEGVETQKQLNYLKSKEFDDIQGFYFSQPLSSQTHWYIFEKSGEY